MKNVVSLHCHNPSQSSSVLTILVPVWFIITPLMFFYLGKLLFKVSFDLKVTVVHRKIDVIYRDVAPLNEIYILYRVEYVA